MPVGFLDLPLELRTIIYRHVFANQDYVVHVDYIAAKTSDQVLIRDNFRETSLLQTCKAIYKETRSLAREEAYRSSKTFSVHPANAWDIVLIPERMRPFVTSLHMTHGPYAMKELELAGGFPRLQYLHATELDFPRSALSEHECSWNRIQTIPNAQDVKKFLQKSSYVHGIKRRVPPPRQRTWTLLVDCYFVPPEDQGKRGIGMFVEWNLDKQKVTHSVVCSLSSTRPRAKYLDMTYDRERSWAVAKRSYYWNVDKLDPMWRENWAREKRAEDERVDSRVLDWINRTDAMSLKK